MIEQLLTVPPGWYILCRSAQVKRRPKRLLFAGHALVAFRDLQGQIGVLEDRCVHRGAPLSQGKMCGNSVQCPYHGWEYDREGSVTSIPALQDYPAAWHQKRAISFRTKEQEGFIWLQVGEDGATVVPPVFANFGTSGWSTFVMQTRFTGSVESCLENFLDCPHATFVHKYWFRAPTKKAVKVVVRTLEDGAQAEFFEEPREKSVVWWFLAPRRGEMQHIDRFIAPNTSRVDYVFPGGMHYIITSSCTPLNEHETLVHTVMTFRYKRIGLLVRLFFEPLSRWIIRQDVAMLGLQQRNLEQTAAQHSQSFFQSTEADLLGPHIIAWRKALLNNESPPPAGQERHVKIYL